MTAKNKKTKGSSSSKAAAAALSGTTKTIENDSSSSPPPPQPSMNPFTKAQLAAIAVLMAGASKLREFHLTLRGDDAATTTCMAYLNSTETCSHPNFLSLVQIKYYSAISLTALVTYLTYQLWSTETQLHKFMCTLVISPLFATMAALAIIGTDPDSTTHIQPSMGWSLCSTATALFVMISPKSLSVIPFLPSSLDVDRSTTTVKYLTPQSAALVALLTGTVWEIARAYLSSGGSSNGLQNGMLITDTLLPAPAKNLIYFWTIDKLAMIALYCFALYHLPMHQQRSLLSAIAIIKFYEYGYQLQNGRDLYQDQSTVEQMTLGLAILSGVAWYAPDASLD